MATMARVGRVLIEVLLMPLRAALTHPAGLAVAGASLSVTLAMIFWPALRPWSERAAWMLLWGGFAYAAVVLVLLKARLGPSFPELEEVYAARQAIEGLRAGRHRERDRRIPSEFASILSQVIVQLDEEIIPALRQLLVRQRELTRQLSFYDSGKLHPDPVFLARLRAIHTRQQEASEDCVRQAANAHAALLALFQEGDDTQIAARARSLAEDLLGLHESLGEVLRGNVDTPSLPDVVSVPETVIPLDRHRGLLPKSMDKVMGDSDERFVRITEEALRRLNNPAGLATCELLDRLCLTVDSIRKRWGNPRLAQATPLEQAQALREAMVAAIERLKPAEEAGGASGLERLHYRILWDEYVLGMSTKHIMVKHNVSESTFHRYRRDAISALANELAAQEELLATSIEVASGR